MDDDEADATLKESLDHLRFMWEGAGAEDWELRVSKIQDLHIVATVLEEYTDQKHVALLRRLGPISEKVHRTRAQIEVRYLAPEEVSSTMSLLGRFPSVENVTLVREVVEAGCPVNTRTGESWILDDPRLFAVLRDRMKCVHVLD